MSDRHPIDQPDTNASGTAFVACVVLGVAGIGTAVAVGLARGDGLQYFFHAHLLNFVFFLSISLGALAFVLVQHVSRAGWSVTVRRPAEMLGANLLVPALLFLPILATVLEGRSVLYPWAGSGAAAESELVLHKQPYLNPAFFTVRAAIYLAVWGLLGWYYLAASLKQDRTGQPALTLRMERLSPLAILLYAGTITFASFDWLMSLDPEWFSTIFGVYFFSGAMVAGLAALILVCLALEARGGLRESVNVEHYHDLGKFLLAFVVFWGYMAYSQYMLIWYGNIPEETTWYLARQEGAWKWVALLLLFGNLILPFCGLLPRSVKRNRLWLGFWAAWLLVFHWIDLYWLVMPSFQPEAASPGWTAGLIDIGLLVGMGGCYLAGLARIVGGRSLVPLADPRLSEAVGFENT
jgi:hypothetical protein